MKTISKRYQTLGQAERYHNYLCNRFDSVRLVESPRWTEHGVYVWQVA